MPGFIFTKGFVSKSQLHGRSWGEVPRHDFRDTHDPEHTVPSMRLTDAARAVMRSLVLYSPYAIRLLHRNPDAMTCPALVIR